MNTQPSVQTELSGNERKKYKIKKIRNLLIVQNKMLLLHREKQTEEVKRKLKIGQQSTLSEIMAEIQRFQLKRNHADDLGKIWFCLTEVENRFSMTEDTIQRIHTNKRLL